MIIHGVLKTYVMFDIPDEEWEQAESELEKSGEKYDTADVVAKWSENTTGFEGVVEEDLNLAYPPEYEQYFVVAQNQNMV